MFDHMTDHTLLVTYMIVTCAAAFLFAVLHLAAAASQFKKGVKPSHALMFCGALGVLAAIVDCVLGGSFDWLLMLLGGGMVCGAAFWNGKSAGKVNPLHHVIRGAVVVVLVLAFGFVV